MTRKRMADSIMEQLDENGLLDDTCMDVVEVAVDEALTYVMRFAQDVSIELSASRLYSEAMVAGVFVNKIKALLGQL